MIPRRFLVALIFLLVLHSVQTLATETPGWLGLGYRYHEDETTAAEAPRGWLLVHGVAPGGPAEAAGLQAHDVIVKIDGKTFRYETDLELLERFASIEPGQDIEFTVKRGTKTLKKTVRAVPMPPQLQEVWRSNYEKARQAASRAQ